MDRTVPKTEEPDELEAYLAKNAARIKPHVRKTKAEIKAGRMNGIKRAQEVRALKLKQRQIIREKIAAGLPITEEEKQVATKVFGNSQGKTEENTIRAAAAALVIKPQSVTALRLLVETTAAKHKYNPIEELIQLTRPGANGPCTLDLKDQVAIHKALLPFLVPQLAAPKAGSAEDGGDGSGVKVVVTQFHFPDRKQAEATPIHEQRPATVATTAEQQPS